MEGEEFDSLVHGVIVCMIAVHRELGPGLLEHASRRAILGELSEQGIGWETEKEIEVFYRGKCIGTERLDLFIERELVAELKAVEALHKRHYA